MSRCYINTLLLFVIVSGWGCSIFTVMMSSDADNVGQSIENANQFETNQETLSEGGREGQSRVRVPTDRFTEWRQETTLLNFKNSVTAWKREATKLDRILLGPVDTDTVTSLVSKLDCSMQNVRDNYERLLATLSPSGMSSHKVKFDQIEQDHFEITRRACSHVRELNDNRSFVSNSSGKKSQKSGGSAVSVERASAAAEAAALKIKLEYMDQEAKMKLDLEQRRLELEKTQAMKEFNMAKVKADVLTEFEMEQISEYRNVDFSDEEVKTFQAENLQQHRNEGSRVRFYSEDISATEHVTNIARSARIPADLSRSESVRLNAHQEIPFDNDPYTQGFSSSHQSDDKTSNQNFEGLVKCLTEQVCLNRLPIPEPGIFCGEPLAFPSWKRAVYTLIEGRGIPSAEKIYYLSKYLGGQAKEAVEGYLLVNSEDGFERAMKLLDTRYGDSFVVANAFRNKLYSWPKVGSRDGVGLRKFADFLVQCEAATLTVPSLKILDDERENQRMLTKLPEWLTLRWGRIVCDWREQKQQFPPFVEFVKFVTKEATIACDPVTSLQSLKANRPTEGGISSFGYGDRSSGQFGHKALATEADESRVCCIVCEKEHDVEQCKFFLSQSPQERKKLVMKKGLCFGCLKQGHRSKECLDRKTCAKCSRRHPTCLHGDAQGPRGPLRESTPEDEYVDSWSGNTATGSNSCCKCSMVVPVWVSHKDNPEQEVLVYAMLDTQSDSTFILDKTCDDLGVKGSNVTLALSTMTDENKRVPSQRIEGLLVRGYNGKQKIELPATYSRKIMPSNRSHIPTPEIAKGWPHLEQIADHLMPLCDADIGLLIGYNCPRALVPRDVIPCNTGPFGQKTDLGWGIVGVVHAEQENDDPIGLSHRVQLIEQNVQIAFQTSVKEVINPSDVVKMMSLDFSDHCPDEPTLSQDDKRFLDIMKTKIRQREDGHYEMPLPLSNPEKKLPNNKDLAARRLRKLAGRFSKDPKYREDYLLFMNNIINSGYAEKVPEEELRHEQVWYIPHHGVYHPKKPNKIRVVFDCSAKFEGESLNDNLLSGPDLTNNLVGVLLRFRQDSIAFVCDIEQMFFQFFVQKEHRDFLRFLWWTDDDIGGNPVEYRMTVHLFGAASSPACANFGLHQAALDNEQDNKESAEFIRRNFYVDDGLKSTRSVESAVGLIKGSQEICRKSGLRLHKFAANKREVLAAVATEDRAQEFQNMDLFVDNLPTERVLGVSWCIESDSFCFRMTLQDRPCTRRGILATVSSIYDPLGFLAPVLLAGKQILQDMCRDGLGWDVEVPDHLKVKWEIWRRELLCLEKLHIQRCYIPEGFGPVESAEIHHFSDASSFGYGQCSYLRVQGHKGIHCALLMGKSRVAPLKPVTVPRLELTAAVISVRISRHLRRELDIGKVSEFFWTDSRIVLGYLSNDTRRFHTFVANRVQQIRHQTSTSQWKYVSSKENPADEASRGISASEFVSSSRWIKGPEFLWKKEIPESSLSQEQLQLNPKDPEVKRIKVHVTQTDIDSGSLIDRLEIMSDWQRAKKAVAVCLRAKEKFKLCSLKKQSCRSKGPYVPCTVAEVCKAETLIIKQLQEAVYHKEITLLQSLSDDSAAARKHVLKGSMLYRLDPFLDSCGVLRVGGRLRQSSEPFEVRHPVILPKKHHITDLIVRHFHEREQHAGRGMTNNAIRSSGFWIVSARSVVAQMIHKCVKCRSLRSDTQQQKMADLPSERSDPAPPFTNCGVDYFGPWYIKDGRKQVKRYGVLFTCLASRAVHIEIAVSLTTDSFINALRRFLAVRGPIRQLRCDQGTNFVGATRELKEAFAELNHGQIRQYLLTCNCDYFEFKMNVPSASHMGGVWERQIRTVRSVLSSMLSHAGEQLDDEMLRTLMCEVMAIINNRPLSVDDMADPLSPAPLTPNHILTMKSRVILSPPGEFVREDLYVRKRWRRVQYLANEFWNRWKKEYLQNLQSRQKWVLPKRNLQVGDIVIVKDVNLPRSQWQLARIEETYKNKDEFVRTVKVALADPHLDDKGRRRQPVTFLERPIHKLVLLKETEL